MMFEKSTLPEYMITYPTVFAVGDNYNIFVPFSDEVIMWVKVGDRKYYDHCNGILRSNTNMHKVEIPMTALNEARSYTVIYRKMIERKPYFPTSEEEKELTFDFRPVPSSGKINLYHVSDAHNLVKEPVNAGRFFGDEIDLLVMNGDIPNHSGDVKNFNAICEIASGITKGNCPAVFARGNHDTRGIHAEDMPAYIPIHNGKTYYTFRVGCVWGIILDCGEDKPDTNAEYGGTICFHEFRLRETDFIKSVIENAEKEYLAEGVQHRLVVCHMPFTYIQRPPFDIEQELYGEWAKLIRENIKPTLMLYGHMHICEVSRVGSERDHQGQACPAIFGSRPIFSKDGENGFEGCAVTLDNEKTTVWFNNDKGEILNKIEL